MINYISKLLYVLPAKNNRLMILLVTFISVSCLEVIGIGLIGPFVSIATNPELVTQSKWLNFAYVRLGFVDPHKFVALLGLSIVAIFCIKSLYSWLVQTYIFKFSYEQKKKLVSRLMTGYLQAPYILFLEKNSAEVIHNVTSQITKFINSILSTLLVAVGNLVTLIAISLFLCVVSPIATFSLILIIIPLFFLFNSFKDKMRWWGQELHHANKGIIRSINHGLGGFKETRIIGCESHFERECAEYARRYADASVGFYAFKLSPRYIVEAILVVFLVSFISISLLLDQNIENLTSTLSVFALASIRLIPAFTNLAGGLSVLRNNSYALDRLYTDLKELEIQNPNSASKQLHTNIGYKEQKINFRDCVKIEQMSYRYPNADADALSNISLTLHKGESIALIGKSGAGKTTLVDVILGLLTPQEGDIKVDGKSIYSNIRHWQNIIGYIPQSIFLIDDTIEKNIAFGVSDSAIDRRRLRQAIEAAQLTEVIKNLPDGLKTRVGERGVMLSGGQRQRVGIARALYHEREILVLDEATSALDNETEKLVSESIKTLSRTKTMIIIAHRLSTVEHCDRIYAMDRGYVVKSGSYEEVVLTNKATSSH